MQNYKKSAATFLALGLLLSNIVMAEEIYEFDIRDQNLAAALRQFAKQSGLQVVYFAAVTKDDEASRSLRGEYSAEAALDQLLDGTDLTYTSVDDRTYSIARGDDEDNSVGKASPASIKPVQMAQVTTPGQQSATTDRISEETERQIVIDEIFVTAQIRKEDFQDVPVTGTVFDAAALENSRLLELDDIARFTPGFSASYFNYSSPNFAVRGAMNTFSQAGASKPVGVFIDDVFVPRNSAAAFELFDVRQLSVLRGPQGTLFGRNVTGGAIQIYTTQPSLDQTKLKFNAGLGNYEFRELSAFASSPLSDSVAGKVSFSYKDRDGFSVDRFNGRSLEDLDSFSLRTAFLFVPTDEIEIRLVADYSKDKSGGKGYSFLSSSDGTDFTGNDGNNRTSEIRVPQSYERDITGISAHLDWSLDSGTVQSITAFRQSDSREFYSLGAADVTLPSVSVQFIKDDNDEPQSFSQEFRFVSDLGQSFDFIAGVYFYDEKTDRFLGDLLLGANGAAEFVNRDFFVDARTESIAAYLSATFHLGDKFDLGIGGRYTSEDKDVAVEYVDNNNNGNNFSTAPGSSFSEFTPRVTLSFFPSDDITIFASRTEGFTAGGFNTETNNIESIELGFSPESITAYEIGAKTAWNDGRFVANLTAFRQEYDNKQEGFLLPGSFFSIFNAAEATMEGAELELAWLISDSFSVNATYSKLDATYDSFVIPGGSDFSGNKLQTAPENTYSVAVDYTRGIGSNTITAGLSYTWQDEYFTGASNIPEFLIDSYALINARFGYAWADGRWAVKLWGKNLADEDFVRIRGTSGALAEYFGPPRTYGINMTYSYE